MKSITLILIICCSTIQLVYAQTTPQGMKYQAVARDLSGEILADKEIALIIDLHSTLPDAKTDYSEMHQILTNKFGLFTLTVGEGRPMSGSFDRVPWSSSDIFMAISIKDETSGVFVTISDSRLLAVPYAFHAATASEIISNDDTGHAPGVERRNWATAGNKNTDPTIHKLGTTDLTDLVIVTSNTERMRISQDGIVTIPIELNVGKDVNIGGELTVERGSPSYLTGTVDVGQLLTVYGPTLLNDSLVVANGAHSHLTGSLVVDGAVNFGETVQIAGALNLHDSLTVSDMAPTHFTGTLDVDKDLNVDGKSDFNDAVSINDRLDLETEEGGFIASFTNTNSTSGGGIVISLGKTHPRWNGSEISVTVPGLTFLNTAVGQTTTLIKGLLETGGQNINAETFQQIGETMLYAFEQELGGQDLSEYASLTCNATKSLIEEINAKTAAVSIPPLSVPSLNIPEGALFDVGDAQVPDGPYHIAGPFNLFGGLSRIVPAIPVPSCPAPGSFNTNWMLPNVSLSSVSNSLSNSNSYLQFTDKDDRILGSVRAESIDNWCLNHLSLNYFLNIFNSFAGVTVVGIDPSQLIETAVKYGINGITQLHTLIEAYNSIGVEYSSGHGDYAEWLERADFEEPIRPGDIVGVVGGKISRDLSNAEQVMAVSSKPIVLGNTPPAGKEDMGNKVAFMGQIPVKIMGSVRTGDFIVGQGDVPGYGVAIRPEDMTVDDFRLAVGRSWKNGEGDGPKMINTVVGVHNGNSLSILKKYQKRLDETDSRLSSLEDRLDMYFPTPANNE